MKSHAISKSVVLLSAVGLGLLVGCSTTSSKAKLSSARVLMHLVDGEGAADVLRERLAQLTGLTITPPANSDADFQLTVAATSREGGTAANWGRHRGCSRRDDQTDTQSRFDTEIQSQQSLATIQRLKREKI